MWNTVLAIANGEGVRERGLMRFRFLPALVAAAIVVAACGGDNSKSSSGVTMAAGTATTTGAASPTTAASGTSATSTAGTPSTTAAADTCTAARKGGSLTMMASGQMPAGLDPVVALGASVGETEENAFYDTLMRYDPDTDTYSPWLATSLEQNADATQWTLKLRPGVKFGNGDPLTAQAVQFSIDRLAKSPRVAAGMAQQIASMQVADDLTIVFTLTAPWINFPYLLAHAGGMVVNPNVVAARGKDFATNPAGAGVGPYEFDHFAPNEEIVLKAKDDYWGGPVCIQTLRFVTIPGSQATYDAFKTGEIGAMLITDPKVIDQVKSDGVTGWTSFYGGNGFQLNSGRGEAPLLADPRLRLAIAHALNPDVVNQRVYDGKGLAASGLTYKGQKIYAGMDGPAYDLKEAQRLVNEVKAEGKWDGTVRITCPNTPEFTELTITTKAMLEAAGFKVEAENLATADANTKILSEGNYQMGCGNSVVFDEAPERGVGQYVSNSVRNRTGIAVPDLDAAIALLNTAKGTQAKAQAMRKIQEVWNQSVPAVWVNAGEWHIAWNNKLHGLVKNIAGVVLFSQAYLAP
jgi:peptide/nickel transport system substrate-binding protein